MTQKNPMIVVLSFPIIFSCYNINFGRNGIFNCLPVAIEVKVTDYEELELCLC